jgi:hypothetical protein
MVLLPVIIFFAGLLALAAASVVAADMRRVERGLAVVSSGHSADE